MKKIIIIIGILLCASTVIAYRTNKPIKLRYPITEEQISQLNNFLEEIWLMQNGRFELDVTATKTGAKTGEIWINSTSHKLEWAVDGVIHSAP